MKHQSKILDEIKLEINNNNIHNTKNQISNFSM